MDHRFLACSLASRLATSASARLGTAPLTRVDLAVTKPARVILGVKDQRHAVVDLGHQFVGIRRDDHE
jgi:hypothetical protein